MGRLATLVDETRAVQPAPRTSPVIHRPLPESVSVERSAGGYVVTGRDALRAVALSDLTDPDALAAAQRRLKRLGVDRALQHARALAPVTPFRSAMSALSGSPTEDDRRRQDRDELGHSPRWRG